MKRETYRTQAALEVPIAEIEHLGRSVAWDLASWFLPFSDEELAEAMAANIDEYGNDLALAADVAAMTPEQRARSENNLRHWVKQARAHIAAQSDCDDRAT